MKALQCLFDPGGQQDTGITDATAWKHVSN
jgi:hypothetical protein